MEFTAKHSYTIDGLPIDLFVDSLEDCYKKMVMLKEYAG